MRVLVLSNIGVDGKNLDKGMEFEWDPALHGDTLDSARKDGMVRPVNVSDMTRGELEAVAKDNNIKAVGVATDELSKAVADKLGQKLSAPKPKAAKAGAPAGAKK